MEKLQEILTVLSLPRMGKASLYSGYGEIASVSGLTDLTALVLRQSREKYTAQQVAQAWDKAGRLLETLQNHPEVSVLTFLDDAYPASLKAMGRTVPPVLYLRGDPAVLSLPNLGVVGTREPSPITIQYGTRIVQRVQARSNRVIVSGLALGCDCIAHEAAVNAGRKTVAVLPSGVLNIIPAVHRGLADRILETGGCLVSEYGLKDGAKSFTYVERDSVIAGLSDGLLVLECGVRSGTMHTVGAAAQLRRPLACFLPDAIPEGQFAGNRFMADAKGAFVFQDHKGLAQFLDRLNGTAEQPVSGSALSSAQQAASAEQGLPTEDGARMVQSDKQSEAPASQSADDGYEQMALPGF